MKNKYYFVIILLCTFLMISCQGERKETPTKGSITVLVDEALAPLIRLEEARFESLYENAHVDLKIVTSREAIVQYINAETTSVIISYRKMNQEEQEVMKRANLTSSEYIIALDAVVAVVNKRNTVDSLRTTQLDSILRGINTSWSNLGWKGWLGSVATCIPNQNSGVFEVLSRKVLKGEKFGAVAKIADSASQILDFVEQNPNGLGLISVSNLRGHDDSVKVLALSDPGAPDSLNIKGRYFTPHQAHIFRGYYPLTSEVTIYSRADQFSVGTGFVSFITSYPGQKIFLDNGLVPATQPVRLVDLTQKELTP